MSGIFGAFNFGINMETLVVLIFGILVIYILGLIVANSYVTFSPKSMARLGTMLFLLGFFMASWIANDYLTIAVSGVLTLFFAIWFIIRAGARKKKVASMQSGMQGRNNR